MRKMLNRLMFLLENDFEHMTDDFKNPVDFYMWCVIRVSKQHTRPTTTKQKYQFEQGVEKWYGQIEDYFKWV